jgi:PAS domain S-box-containing protein
MKTEIVVFIILILLISGGAGLITSRHAKKVGANGLLVLAASLTIWSLAFLLSNNNQPLGFEKLLTAVMQVCMLIVASVQFGFSLATTIRGFIWKPGHILLLSTLPILSLVRFTIEPWLPANLGNVWENIVLLTSCILSGVGSFLFWETFFETPRSYHTKMWVLPVASILPFVSQLLDLQGINILPIPFSSSLPAFALLAASIAHELISQNFAEAISFTDRRILNTTSDGLMVINRQNTIININSAFEQITGQSRDRMVGKSVSSALGTIPYLYQPITGIYEFERKRLQGSPDNWQYLNIKFTPLLNQNNEPVGRLIIWRDTTNRRRAEDARQKAREEMFVLINSISSVARESASLEEFLSETIYQIIHPFHSQIVLVFLEDDRKHDGREPQFFLASHFGLHADSLSNILNVPISSSLFGQSFIDQQPLLVEDVSRDVRIPSELKQSGLESLIITPLITRIDGENRVLGFMCLGRIEKPVYSSDEIARLTAICDHLASLIDNDRRRKLSIALSERKGLMRDLHDSVSQKLYGLVTQTEAAQAALEAGNTIDPSQVLLRIGENARQAVREMRLFLYQMQPPDLEKDGFVSAIHHRLSAVEGRADIKVKFLADEGIALSKEKEIELYYIAQEALNNIMRHARAKAVTLKLRQGRKNVILEIQDDGHGFDSKNLDRAGLGLTNMKERALKINGRLKILTKPGQGTRINISVPRDLIIKQA